MKTGSFLAPFVAAGVFALSVSPGLAQSYPDRAITYIVPTSAGSGSDLVGRMIADVMSKTLGQPVTVENRPGAGGNIGAQVAAEAEPDGYTILQINNNHTVNMTLYDNLTYDLKNDFIPVTQLAFFPFVILANPALGVKSLSELIELAKAKPGEINQASAGVGSGTFMAAALFKSMAGVDLAHIPYDGGGTALTSVVAGETMIYAAPSTTAIPLLKDEQVVGLAVSSPERSPVLPDLPSVSEVVPGYEFTSWNGLVVPSGTSDEVVQKIHDAALAALHDPTVNQRLLELGYVVVGDSPDQFSAFLDRTIIAMEKLVRENDLKPE